MAYYSIEIWPLPACVSISSQTPTSRHLQGHVPPIDREVRAVRQGDGGLETSGAAVRANQGDPNRWMVDEESPPLLVMLVNKESLQASSKSLKK